MSVNEKMTAIADEIRDKTGGTKALTLDDMASGVNEVYETGKQAEYNAFWDAAQQNGTRTNYQYFYAGPAWTNETFRPKYSMRPINASTMFHTTLIEGDLVEILEKQGVELDTSTATNISQMYTYAAKLTRIGIIDASSTTDLPMVCFYCLKLVTIDKLKLKDDGTNTFSNSFSWCSALENLIIEGVIGNAIDFQWCPLTKASITSVMNALSSTVTGQTVTFKKTAKEAAFTADEWAALIATKSNWTFSLV